MALLLKKISKKNENFFYAEISRKMTKISIFQNISKTPKIVFLGYNKLLNRVFEVFLPQNANVMSKV